MDFSHSKPRRHTEPALPMINVVFLLLIFFLMSAQIVTPPPFEIAPPVAKNADTAKPELRVHISADAELAVGDSRGPDTWTELAHVSNPADAHVLLRADAALEAAELARVLARLSALGFQHIQLATVQR